MSHFYQHIFPLFQLFLLVFTYVQSLKWKQVTPNTKIKWYLTKFRNSFSFENIKYTKASHVTPGSLFSRFKHVIHLQIVLFCVYLPCLVFVPGLHSFSLPFDYLIHFITLWNTSKWPMISSNFKRRRHDHCLDDDIGTYPLFVQDIV